MFDFGNTIIKDIFNPLSITKKSLIEFNIGDLVNTGLYSFKKIIEFKIGEKSFVRYVIYSKSENSEFVFEVFPTETGELETFLYRLDDTIPFSEDFLAVVGELYLTTPDGTEYSRCMMPDDENRIDGLEGYIKIYDVNSGKIEKETSVTLWDYQCDIDNKTQYLNIEMASDSGIFKIFVGEMIENIFYKFYQAPK